METQKPKVSFEAVELQVLKMQEQGYHLSDIDVLDNHFTDIINFIEACGWNLDDYVDHLMGWNKDHLN